MMKKKSAFKLPKYLRWLPKALYFVCIALLIGFLFRLTTPKSDQPEDAAGFAIGVLHGAMMPASMPSLVMGVDVPIYASNNAGIPYKLGYTVGVNACGALFFGLLFFQFMKLKRQKKSSTKESVDKNQNSSAPESELDDPKKVPSAEQETSA